MLDSRRLHQAIDAQQRSYAFLRWLAEARVPLEVGGDACRSSAESAHAWIDRHYGILPDDCGPATRDPEDLVGFSNVLASYLETSFEWDDLPRLETILGPCG